MISIDIVLSNSGNQYIVIERAMIMAGGITKEDNSMKKNLFSIIKIFDASSDEGYIFPKILKPGEMYLAKLRASYDLINFINKVINVNNEYYPNIAIVKLEIRTMNNQGKTFTVLQTCSSISHGDTGGSHLSGENDVIDRSNLIDLLTNFTVTQPQLREEVQPFLVP